MSHTCWWLNLLHPLARRFFRGQAPNPKLAPWLTAQDQWTVAQIAANPADPFWQQINLIRQQFEGLVVGYQSVA